MTGARTGSLRLEDVVRGGGRRRPAIAALHHDVAGPDRVRRRVERTAVVLQQVTDRAQRRRRSEQRLVVRDPDRRGGRHPEDHAGGAGERRRHAPDGSPHRVRVTGRPHGVHLEPPRTRSVDGRALVDGHADPEGPRPVGGNVLDPIGAGDDPFGDPVLARPAREVADVEHRAAVVAVDQERAGRVARVLDPHEERHAEPALLFGGATRRERRLPGATDRGVRERPIPVRPTPPGCPRASRPIPNVQARTFRAARARITGFDSTPPADQGSRVGGSEGWSARSTESADGRPEDAVQAVRQQDEAQRDAHLLLGEPVCVWRPGGRRPSRRRRASR